MKCRLRFNLINGKLNWLQGLLGYVLFLVASSLEARAQTIENIRTSANNEKVFIEYDLDGDFNVAFNIDVGISFDSAYAISPKRISGDINGVLPGKNKRIVWEAFNELGAIEAEISVVLKIQNSNMKVTKIGTQVWMVKNLNVNRFRNGDLIPHAKTAEEWIRAGENQQPAWCYYNNDSLNGEKYGRLYNRYAINDPRGLAPDGWKIPSLQDWRRLLFFLGDREIGLRKMKSKTGWAEYYKGANESGFDGFPSGLRKVDGSFGFLGQDGFFWSTTGDMYSGHGFSLAWYVGDAESYEAYNANCGLSIRCLKD